MDLKDKHYVKLFIYFKLKILIFFRFCYKVLTKLFFYKSYKLKMNFLNLYQSLNGFIKNLTLII
jgi:hypothetical protein